MVAESELGPPRTVWSIPDWQAEIKRQKELVKTGDLRRYQGLTYGWCKSGGHWKWLSRFSTYGGGLWPNREDREQAWEKLKEELT